MKSFGVACEANNTAVVRKLLLDGRVDVNKIFANPFGSSVTVKELLLSADIAIIHTAMQSVIRNW